jgi:hypothetical protein
MFENLTVNVNALCNSCAKIACCLSELIFTFLYAGSSIQNASEQVVSCIQVSFVHFALHPTPATKIYRNWVWRFKRFNRGNYSAVDTFSHNDQKTVVLSSVTLYIQKLVNVKMVATKRCRLSTRGIRKHPLT